MSAQKLIIDTDPGLDDAIAILFAARACQFDVLGVTTVAGNIGLDVTTRNAARLLALARRGDVPVHAGASAPLARGGINEERIHGADGLGGVALPDGRAAGGDAIGFLADTLRAAPSGSIEIHALGPLTNIAHLIQTAPDAAARIGRVVAMGGCIDEPGNTGPRSEFNLAHDPEAAQVVLGSGLALTIIPLDVTRRVRAGDDWLARLRGQGDVAQGAHDLIQAYFGANTDRESRPLHDPCVPLYALAPDLFGIEARQLDVDLTGDPGALIAGPYRCDVAMTVQAGAVLDRLALGLL